MASNKDEAEKVMAEAEKRFVANDLAGANKLANKAQSLCPSHTQIPKLLAALRVHIAAAAISKNRFPSIDDCCSILGSKTTDDIETIKKQYKKMCLLVHPDKNKSAAAEGAFKYVSNAWEALLKYKGSNSSSKPNASASSNTNCNGGTNSRRPGADTSSNANCSGSSKSRKPDASTNSGSKPNGGSSSRKPDASSGSSDSNYNGGGRTSGPGSGSGTDSSRSSSGPTPDTGSSSGQSNANSHAESNYTGQSNANSHAESNYSGQGSGPGFGPDASSDRNQSAGQGTGSGFGSDNSSDSDEDTFGSNFASSSGQSSSNTYFNSKDGWTFSSAGFDFASNFYGKVEMDVLNHETELVRKMFSWSLEDVFNRNLYKDEVSKFLSRVSLLFIFCRQGLPIFP